MKLQNTVKEALNMLYHQPDNAVRMQADRWLQEFQRTLDAWQVSDNLLHDASSNPENLLFCSQTLRNKVQRDFEELPSETFRPLRDSLNSLLKTFHKGPPIVRTHISLVFAALVVHIPAKDWGDVGIVNRVRSEMNAHPEYIPSFLELVRVLPEVMYALLALTRAYGPRALEWAKQSVSLIPTTTVTDLERSRFLQALSDVASGMILILLWYQSKSYLRFAEEIEQFKR